MPTVSRKLTLVVGFALAVGALGGGVALAASSNQAPSVRPAVKPAPAAVAPAAVKPAALAPAAVKPAAVAPKAAKSGLSAADTDTLQQGDQTTPDAVGSAAESEPGSEQETESATESDGPGGHEDPAGNVDHQFEGEE